MFQEPQIAFSIAPGLQCVPFEAHFIDQSFAETPISYQWDFGDGNTSTTQNPTNIYTNVGPFVVALTITTSHGCIDTLTLIRPDLVDVHPKPIAGFSIDPELTDICHSEITFTDLSVGASTYYYWYDDGSAFGNQPSPRYVYRSDGDHKPVQIVTSEFGCKDTAEQVLYIEPFTVYAPNTFTPDGNMFNNTFLPVVYLEVQEWKLELYNRWGELIFESSDVDQGWDGTSQNGRIAQDGTYYWTVTYVSCEPINPEQIISGHVTLLR